MGNTLVSISNEKITDCITNTVFSKDEVRALWSHFHNISLGEDNINKIQFKKAMLFKDSTLIDRIYRVFDADDDNLISFDEFITCLSVISNKTSQEDKLKLSFKIYDYNSDNYISNSDLIAVLAATLREHNLVITRQAIEEVVDKTIKEGNPEIEGMLSYDEYKKLVLIQPHLLNHFTLNISGIIAEYSSNTGISFATPR